jgi:ABC-type branched-subunit amino acid transport system substrate-binding protein
MQRRTVLTAASQASLLTLLGTTSALTAAQGITDSQIVLGQSAPFSGPAEQLGVQFHEGAKLYFENINAKGGVHGRRIELKHLDDEYEPDRCAANTKQFITDDVFALFGYIGTPTSLAALPLATDAKVPFFAPFTGAQGLREPFNRYAVHIRASYFDETAAIVRQLTTAGIKKIAVFYQNDAYGQAGLAGVVRALKALNLEPLVSATVERNSTDVTAALETIMPRNPEAIVQISAYKSCAAFIRQARKKGFPGNFYNVSFVGTQALANELGSDSKGVIISQVMPFPYTPLIPVAGEYLDAIKASSKKHAANYSGIEGFVAAKVFVEALRRAGKALSREAFLSAIDTLQNFNLGGWSVDFGPNKRTASHFVELTLLTPDGRVRR